MADRLVHILVRSKLVWMMKNGMIDKNVSRKTSEVGPYLPSLGSVSADELLIQPYEMQLSQTRLANKSDLFRI